MIIKSFNLLPGNVLRNSNRTFICGLCRFFIIMILFASCRKTTGEGPITTEQRSFSHFSGIALNIPGSLEFTPDSIYSVEIKAQANIQPLIQTIIKDGTLEIGLKNRERLGHHKPIEVFIHAPHITRLSLSGSAGIFILKPLQSEKLALSISGSGNIQSDSLILQQALECKIAGSGNMDISSLKSDQIHVDISGSGNIFIRGGEAVDGMIHVSGSGKLDLLSLFTHNMTIRSSGSGDARLNVSEKLEVHISGSGNIYYKGNPQITTSISGSGKIISL